MEIICMHFILSCPRTSLHILYHIHYKKIATWFSENEGGRRPFGIFPKLHLPLHLITGLKNVKLIIWWTLTAIQNDHPAFDTYLGHVSSAWQFTFLFPLRRPAESVRWLQSYSSFHTCIWKVMRGFPSSAESDPYERGRNIPLTNQYGTARWKHLDEVTWSLSEVSNEATHKI